MEAVAAARQDPINVVAFPTFGADRTAIKFVGERFFKISALEGTDEILGATIVGPNAGDMISEITICMQHNIGLSSLAGTIHPYPTSAEAVRFFGGMEAAAGGSLGGAWEIRAR